MRDEETSVGGTLHGAEDTGTGGSAVETDIKVGLERAASLTVDFTSLGQLVLSIGFLNTLEDLVKLELGKSAAGEKKTGSVGSGPVGKTVLDAVAGELVRVGSAEDLVADDLGLDDLADDLYSQ